MHTLVRISPIPGGGFLASYRHPLYEKDMHKFFTSEESARSYKQLAEHAINDECKLEEMRIQQLLILFKEERPESLLFTHRPCFLFEFLETFGDLLPQLITAPAIDAWISRYAKERGHREVTTYADKTFLNYFFRFLIEKGLIEKTPIAGQWAGNPENNLAAEEVALILSETKRLSPGLLYPMALLAIEAKALSGEIMGLRWKYVDLKGGRIIFERSGYPEVHRMSDELKLALTKIRRTSLNVFNSQAGRPMDGNVMFQARGRFRNVSAFKGKWTLDDLRRAS